MEPGRAHQRPIRMAGDWPFLGSEALAAGLVSRYELDTRHEMIHRDVYIPRGAVMTPVEATDMAPEPTDRVFDFT